MTGRRGVSLGAGCLGIALAVWSLHAEVDLVPVAFTHQQSNDAASETTGSFALAAPTWTRPDESVQLDMNAIDDARAAGAELHAGRQNVFFDEATFTQDLLLQNPQLVSALGALLGEEIDAADLGIDSDLMVSRPEKIVSRMAAIDLLESVVTHDPDGDAVEAKLLLRDIVERAVGAPGSIAVKRVAVAEKYDALVVLTRTYPGEAIEVYRGLQNPDLAKALGEALEAGLVDAGMARAEVAPFVASLRGDG